MNEGNTINGLALCAGTGGLELGTHIAIPGLRTVCYVEREAAAAASLVARMEDKTLDTAPVWDNLGTFDGKPWRGVVDFITSGDPCQPNSTAGKRQGEDDDRWMLDQVLRIIDEIRPSRVFRENVTGNADGQLRVFIPALEAMGYSVAAGIFSASEVGASHRRERLFVLGNAPGTGLAECGGQQAKMGQPGKVAQSERPSCYRLADPDGAKLRPDGRESVARPDGRHNTARSGADVANTQHSGCARRDTEFETWPGQNSNAAVPYSEGMDNAIGDGCGTGGEDHPKYVGHITDPASQLPLFAPGPSSRLWGDIFRIDPGLAPSVPRYAIEKPGILGLEKSFEPAFCRMAHGLAYRNDRLRLCGNGVFPLEAAYAYTTLAAHFDAAGTGSTDAVLSVSK